MERIKLSERIAWQVMPDKSFAYVCNYDSRQYYKFEDTGMLIWLCIADNEPIKKNELQNKIAHHYGIEQVEIKEDLDEFVRELVEEGLVEIDE